MNYYPKETISGNIKIAERIFDIFNKELFDNEIRAYIKIDERRKYLNSVNVCSNIVYSHDLGYEIDIPLKLMNKNDETIPTWILTQMIIIHGMLYNLKLASNRNTYKNKRFKKEADKYGLITKYGKYGWEPVGLSNNSASLIKDCIFEKVPVFYEDGITNKNSSTKKYVDNNGESVRATKDYHILYCITDYPEDIIEKVDAFMTSLGIARMALEAH